MARKPDAAKRAQILAAARTEFLAQGFKGASMERIAHAAGIAKGTVYLYFDSKEAVFHAVLEGFFGWILEKARAAAQEPGPIERRLARVLEAKFGGVHQFASTSPYGKELLDSSYAVSSALLLEVETAFVQLLAALLDVTEETGWMVFRAARGTDFTFGPALTSAQLRARLEALSAVLVKGLSPRSDRAPASAKPTPAPKASARR